MANSVLVVGLTGAIMGFPRQAFLITECAVALRGLPEQPDVLKAAKQAC